LALQYTHLGNNMAVAVEGCDLRESDPATVEALHQALLDSLVLCVRDQHLDPREFRDAMLSFG
jgi:alpha-ketoglutarate-dependent taurine dioxygenase